MTEKSEFRLSIWTPYLTESMDQLRRCMETQASDPTAVDALVQEQVEVYGHDPNNLNGVRTIPTERYLISVTTRSDPLPKRPHLIMAGCTETGEREVIAARDTGVLVARYSVFYGNSSEYTGRTPASSGYSFDLPKKVAIAKAMITDDDVLDALVAREEAKIRKAIDKLNQTIEAPILMTPYLGVALEIK